MGAGSKRKKKRDKGEIAQVFVGSKSLRVTSLIAFLYKEDKVMMWHYDMVPLIQGIAHCAFIPNILVG